MFGSFRLEHDMTGNIISDLFSQTFVMNFVLFSA